MPLGDSVPAQRNAEELQENKSSRHNSVTAAVSKGQTTSQALTEVANKPKQATFLSPSPLHHTFLLGRARFTAQPLSVLIAPLHFRRSLGELSVASCWGLIFAISRARALETMKQQAEMSMFVKYVADKQHCMVVIAMPSPCTASSHAISVIILESPAPGGHSGFQVTGMIEWGQKSKPKKIAGLKFNAQKNLMPNFQAIKFSRKH